MLAEHRIGGLAVLPGTAYVEIASAAALRVGLGESIALQQLNFLSPLAMRGGRSRQARVTLTPLSNDDYRVEVESRANAAEEWLLHFEARLSALADAPAPVAAGGANKPIGEARLSLEERGVDFGARWRNVRAASCGPRAAEAEFALPPAFADDVQRFRAHPALLDTAAATGRFLSETGGDDGVYAPVAMGAVRVFKAVPAHIFSRARMISDPADADAVFDVDLSDESGAVAEIGGATYRRVTFDLRRRRSRRRCAPTPASPNGCSRLASAPMRPMRSWRACLQAARARSSYRLSISR